jgi:hypothetical protein
MMRDEMAIALSHLPQRGEVEGREQRERASGGGQCKQITLAFTTAPHPDRFAIRPPRVGGGEVVALS